MGTELTAPAIQALDELHSASFINWMVRGSIFDPSMGGKSHHPNWQFFQSMEWYLTCREITHAADVLNTYCQSLLAEVLDHDPTAWSRVSGNLRRYSNCRKAVADLRKQRGPDNAVRKIFGEELGTFWNAEMDLISVIRNKIVHQAGYDPGGDVKKAITKCQQGTTMFAPPNYDSVEIPVDVDTDDRLVIDALTGNWASEHVSHNIHCMDQTVSARFSIPGQRWVPKPTSYKHNSKSQMGPIAPGTPLPVAEPDEQPIPASPTLPPFYEYEPMANQKEIDCAKTLRSVRKEIDEFVRAYCAEIEIEIHGLNACMAGSIQPHTIDGHDYHLGYQLCPKKSDRAQFELGIRLRQEDFEPFLTIWSDKTAMRDFRPCALTSTVQDQLRDNIDRAHST